ncbi:unnamed protein product [Chrysoparadoxa australica]
MESFQQHLPANGTFGEVALKEMVLELEEAKQRAQRRLESLAEEQAEADALRESYRASTRGVEEEERKVEKTKWFADEAKRDLPPSGPRLPLPLFNRESVGLAGRWESIGGNFVLKPPEGVEVRAVIHFLGGALVGAAPHLTYNYLLSGVAEMGFVVVATPYPMSFDYLEICDGILERFESAALPLAEEYGALPVVGVGHSCGALLQLLITCLFPDTPRAANCLISFNNKPVQDAVPLFEELVLPLATRLLAEHSAGSMLSDTLYTLRQTAQNLAEDAVRLPVVPKVVETELLPLTLQALKMADQLPPLFRAVAEGTKEFVPSPEETDEVVRKMYRARRTLVVEFETDSIDESPRIKEVIGEGKTLLRMRRPMIDMGLRYEVITGTHVTPLTQNIFLKTPLDRVDPLLPVREGIKGELLKTVGDAFLKPLLLYRF